jgi:AcrR family transcriptional regulator
MAAEVHTEGLSTRHRILQIALTLMSQRGVDATSMRDLASAAGLNVASLYHYFPSKRELLEAVLGEQGFLPVRAAAPHLDADPSPEMKLTAVLTDILVSMFAVEDFVRLMLGEAIRAEETARSVGKDLFQPFQTSIEDWVIKNRPDLHARSGAAAVARLLSAMVVGIFVEYQSGVLSAEGDDLTAILTSRAREAAQILS